MSLFTVGLAASASAAFDVEDTSTGVCWTYAFS